MEEGGTGRLALAAVPAGVFLSHINAGYAEGLFGRLLAVLVFGWVGEGAGAEDEFVVGPDWGLVVADQLDPAEASFWRAGFSGCERGLRFKGMVRLGWEVLCCCGAGPEGDDVDGGFGLPGGGGWGNWAGWDDVSGHDGGDFRLQ